MPAFPKQAKGAMI